MVSGEHPEGVESRIALFEDAQTDARMRATIPQFALLGAVLVAGTAPFFVPTMERKAIVLGVAAGAAVSAFVLPFRGLIERVTHAALFTLLAGYCVLIAVAVAASDDNASPYRFLFLVPALFSAAFFTGAPRYGIALLAPVLEHAIAGTSLDFAWDETAFRALMFLFVAHFGAVVSDTLRESLRASRALHTVLEAASGSPLDIDVAAIGLEAALAVIGWSAGAVLVPEEDSLRVAAWRGDVEDATDMAAYEEQPTPLADADLFALHALRTGEPVFIEDIGTLRDPDNPIVALGVRSIAFVPLVHHGDTVAILVTADRAVRSVDADVKVRLEQVARQLALALGSVKEYRRETELTARLLELNRRKDEFLANVSHELRTPAATIKLVASTLRSAGDRLSDEQRAEMYATLERRSQNLTDLIESLLEQAVAEAGVARLRVSQIEWRSSLTRWAEIAKLQTGREITLHLPTGVVIGTGDAVRLERVVANLLSNAAKFSDPKTPIDLTLTADDATVAIEVADQGVGIDATDAERIFDRFHQVQGGATRSAGGFGIGLSLVRSFVEAHGGTIEVDSTPGVGSRFTVRIPRLQPEPELPG